MQLLPPISSAGDLSLCLYGPDAGQDLTGREPVLANVECVWICYGSLPVISAPLLMQTEALCI